MDCTLSNPCCRNQLVMLNDYPEPRFVGAFYAQSVSMVQFLSSQPGGPQTFVKFVQDAKKSGKTVDDVVKTWKTPAKYDGYNAPQEARVRSDAQVVWDETK